MISIVKSGRNEPNKKMGDFFMIDFNILNCLFFFYIKLKVRFYAVRGIDLLLLQAFQE